MSELSITTTQNVVINFKAASVGDRMLAYFIDLIIKIAYGIVVFTVFFYYFGIKDLFNELDQWSIFAIILFFYFPILL